MSNNDTVATAAPAAPARRSPLSAVYVRPLHRTADDSAQAPYTLFDVVPYSRTIGAEIRGVDLSAKIDPQLQAELHRCLLEWKVIFFRDQRLDSRAHRDMASLWGKPEVHPFLPKADHPEVVLLQRGEHDIPVENVWHSDVSFMKAPAMGSILKAVQVPQTGGDTLWADMAVAYDGLSDAVKERVEGKMAVHRHQFGRGLAPEEKAKKDRENPPQEHPVVRTHPETGQKLIYVNKVFTSHILGMDRDESDELLEILMREATHPEYQCRFHWEPGSVAFWDNRATQHYACGDYYPDPRTMQRVTITGDVPF
ncbi:MULTISPECIES: TauD/TfdA family dioxygenase [unclassified Rhodococcus (in: high G+C Gram-positive bacteria)]|uniref:TauD/TfdA dioxygenase family protein n=1 Tax=unclassified Rhodococcus (in: high G+C Gram-positive bacteria) TaxID=192944 RepID=UPI001FF78719|nr:MULTISPECIES: TauD/TfdA family dioxygenase [unclassified Rhodococcus (in: high G+C Gram-positive bacteria)]